MRFDLLLAKDKLDLIYVFQIDGPFFSSVLQSDRARDESTKDVNILHSNPII
jgi:hypothetical protein